MPYILEFDKNFYTKNSLMSIEKVRYMCECNGENLLPLCPDCKTVLITDSQTKHDYYAWCADCGHDYYENEITHYEVK